jgi:hypothetical protein
MDYVRRPTRRSDGPSAYRAVLGTIILFLLVIIVMWWFSKRVEGVSRTTPYPSHDSLAPTYLYDGKSVIRWYVFIDPDTGMQYLVNDRGGCTPRLDSNGKQMGGTNG